MIRRSLCPRWRIAPLGLRVATSKLKRALCQTGNSREGRKSSSDVEPEPTPVVVGRAPFLNRRDAESAMTPQHDTPNPAQAIVDDRLAFISAIVGALALC